MKKKTGITKEVRKGLAEMGVTDAVFATIRSASNHTDGIKALEEAKSICRKGFKEAAMKYHPDRNYHLSEEERGKTTKRFKRLKSIHDDFIKSRYTGARRRRTGAYAKPYGPSPNDDIVDDMLRYWNDPEMLNFVRNKRRARQAQRSREVESIFDEMAQSSRADLRDLARAARRGYGNPTKAKAEKTLTLARMGGIWLTERSKWVQTQRPKNR